MFKTYAEAAAAIQARGVAAGDPLVTPLADARMKQDAYFQAMAGEMPPPTGSVENLHIPGPAGPIPLRLYHPSSAGDAPAVLFVRGAGWWAGGLDSHARTMQLFASLSGCAVCGIDYRRTPEFHYPVQKDEVLSALHWLAGSGANHRVRVASGIVVLGESAGATLGLSAAQALRDGGEQGLLCGLLLFYGNFAGPKPTARAYSQWVWQQYLGDPARATDPGAVPLLADMKDLPPVWLGAGEADPLIADTAALAAKLQQAGVPHEFIRYPDMPHAFVMLNGLLEPAAKAVADAAAAARRMLGLKS
jgi:acetyl esterase